MEPKSFAPELELTGRAVLVCGGGSAALGPVRALLDAGAQVTVVGAEIATTIAELGITRRSPVAPTAPGPRRSARHDPDRAGPRRRGLRINRRSP